MKTLLIISFFAFANILPTNALADTETNPIYAIILQARASNDVKTVIQSLPKIEKLWPQNPEVYYKSVTEAVGLLASTSRIKAAKPSLLNIWTNVIQKPLPVEELQATRCLGLKKSIVITYLNLDYINSDKSHWIDVVTFIGEIRSRIIPNYMNQTMMISVDAVTPAEKLQLQKVLEENERKKIPDELQRELFSANTELTFRFLGHIPDHLRKDAAFVKTASSAARLTDDEVRQLKGE